MHRRRQEKRISCWLFPGLRRWMQNEQSHVQSWSSCHSFSDLIHTQYKHGQVEL